MPEEHLRAITTLQVTGARKLPFSPKTTAPRTATARRRSCNFREATFFPQARTDPPLRSAAPRAAQPGAQPGARPAPRPAPPHLAGGLPRAGRRLQRAVAAGRRVHGRNRTGPATQRPAAPGTRFMEGARAAPNRPPRGAEAAGEGGRKEGGGKHRPPQLRKGLVNPLTR